MRRLPLLIALLSLAAHAEALSVTGATSSTVTLNWDANTEPDVSTYAVQQASSAAGPFSTSLTTAATAGVVAGLAPGNTYFFIVRAINTGGFWSAPSNVVSITLPGQTIDVCAPVTGQYAISIFPTSLLKTGSGGANSKTRFDFQVSSPNAPVTSIIIKAGSTALSSMAGSDLGALAGMWFAMPTSGTYTMNILAANSQGCTRAVSYNVPLVVP
jgi:Fibronectin type III domain